MSKLRVATLNIWNRSGPWVDRLPLIRDELVRLDPSVVGLQEVLRHVPYGSAPFEPHVQNCQATEIASGLGYQVVYAEASDYGSGLKFGNALLTRHPVLRTYRFTLPDLSSGESRSLLGVFLETPFGALPVFVTHLNWKLFQASVRLEQVQFIVDRIFELAPTQDELLPPILMGDFNADPDSDEIRFLCGLKVENGKSVYFADAWRYAGDGSFGATFCRTNGYARSAREPSRRIDYIFTRGPDSLLRGEPVRTELAFAKSAHKNGVEIWPSDHFGVVSEIELAPRSP